jgi:hypothetical protein
LACAILRLSRGHKLGVIVQALGLAAGRIAYAACVDRHEMLAAVAEGLFSIEPAEPGELWQ